MTLFPALGRLFVLIFSALLFASGAHSAEKSIVVFDASGSMWAQIDGKSRIEIARETIRNVIGTLPADKEIGLMAYGHREKGSCTDIELLVAPAAGTGAAIIAATDKINPKGKTPLSEAVKRAAEELKYTEEKATVILVTDGLETCNADPCALGNELEKAGVDFTAHVVGFGLSAEEGKKVACLAENTGGKYIQASDASQLTEALKTTVVVAAPEPEPAPAPEPAKVEFNVMPTVLLVEGGGDVTPEVYGDVAWEFNKMAADGSIGENVTTEYNGYKGLLPAGDYILVARMGAARAEQKITLTDNSVLKPVVIMNAGLVKITPYASEGAEPSESASVEYTTPGGPTTSYGPNKIVLPAGEQSVKVRIGEGEVIETFTLKAGETVDKKIVVGTGHVVANAFYVEGMKLDAPGMGIEIFKAKMKIDGSQDQVAQSYGPDAKFDLPQGDYILRAKADGAKGEVPFTVKVGERVEPVVILNAGVVKVSAPGNDGWRFLSAKENLNGDREVFDYGYNDAFQTTLVAGDYLIETELKATGEKKLTPITVKAGERLELTIQ
jgi:Ca-activated chloride channel family protein